MSASLKEFIAEAEESLQQAEEYIIQLQESLDSEPDPETLNALFRTFHTLKGNSALFGQDEMKELTHGLEELLDDLRMGRIEITQDEIDFLFKQVDVLRKTIKALGEGEKVQLEDEIKEVKEFRKSRATTQKKQSLENIIDKDILKVLSEYEEHRLRENIKNQKAIYYVDVVFPMDGFDKALMSLSEKIKETGELISTLPTTTDVPEGSIGFRLVFASAMTPEELRAALQMDPKTLYTPSTKRPTSKAASSVRTPESIKSTASTLRVDIDKIDRILDTVGELYLSRGMFKTIEQQLRELYGYTDVIFELHRANQLLDRSLSELQHSILDIRMVPIGQVFSRVAQVLRRYARQMNKKVELHVYGEDTELDKYVAEEIADPLMHIIRNSIDHGIEDPEERLKAGKPDTGHITLRAYQKGNHVVVEVEDDGRGINRERLLEKARAGGIIKDDAVLTDTEVLELIFTPGLSTKEVATEVSGRGVGMDVVKEKVVSLGGFVDIRSEQGRYTRISLTLPITLAIIKALMVRAGGCDLAVALTSVVETLEIQQELINSVEGRLIYNLRGKPVPLVRLSQIYGLDSEGSTQRYILIVGFEDRQIGLVVDDVYGTEDIVIKPLGPYFEGFRGFAGAAEVGSGNLILVVDTEAIISETLIRNRTG